MSSASSNGPGRLWRASAGGLFSGAAMFLFELVKEAVHPGPGHWSSHALTIAFATTIGCAATWLVLGRYHRLVKALQQSLADVRQLTGLLPICMFCKQVRDDQGYWHRVEKYISERTDASFSHGLCPACQRKHFPDDADGGPPPR